MTIEIALMIDDLLVQTNRYESAIVPIPNIGEAIINPQTDGLAVKVRRRIFDYGKDHIRITLDCV